MNDFPELHRLLFWALAIGTGFCAIAVVVSQNIVRSATWLLFTLAGASGIFFLLGADFVGATQLLVYVGGTLVLVVFGVMLTAQGPFITMKTRAAEWGVSLAVGLLFFAVLAISIRSMDWPEARPGRMDDARASTSSTRLGLAFFGFREATPHEDLTSIPPSSSQPAQGKPGGRATERKRMAYLLPFEIVSVHLLVVLLGAAYLARAKRRRGTLP
jgi:NADH:ubiquinone oxidoreductase subunit 6 (subunit J)